MLILMHRVKKDENSTTGKMTTGTNMQNWCGFTASQRSEANQTKNFDFSSQVSQETLKQRGDQGPVWANRGGGQDSAERAWCDGTFKENYNWGTDFNGISM